MDAWSTSGAADLGRDIAAGRIDPVDLAEHFLAAIDSHPHGPSIYARTTAERARAEAAAARARAWTGLRRHPLDGVPVSWKDLVDTAGTATEGGSALLAGRVPGRDAAALARATEAGLVCLGKTHQTELAFSGLGLNPITATPPCINDAEAVPGGSSSGAAASVAWGLAPAAVGSDTAGSVRLPAAWNDLVGLRTSHGRVPLDGVLPLCPRFDTLGPLARSVEDAALVASAMAGERPPDLEGATLRGARVAILRTVALEAVEPAPAAAFEAACRALEAAGATLSEMDVPAVSETMDLAGILFGAEAYGVWGRAIEANPDAMYPPVRDRFRSGAGFAAHDYVAAWRRLDELRRAYQAATAAFDAVILPACAIVPPKRAAVEADPEHFAERNLKTLRNTRIGSLLGLCGLTLPVAPSAGVLLQAPGGDDIRLLRIGMAAERALA
jgi:aspartyl-tRNA(Asn)/glutamyl-tRNA(Gln) amidotransferase subunit A